MAADSIRSRELECVSRRRSSIRQFGRAPQGRRNLRCGTKRIQRDRCSVRESIPGDRQALAIHRSRFARSILWGTPARIAGALCGISRSVAHRMPECRKSAAFSRFDSAARGSVASGAGCFAGENCKAVAHREYGAGAARWRGRTALGVHAFESPRATCRRRHNSAASSR